MDDFKATKRAEIINRPKGELMSVLSILCALSAKACRSGCDHRGSLTTFFPGKQ